MFILLVSESGGDFAYEGSITGSSFLSDGGPRMQYEAESPDELSLVKAASTYGCKLTGRSPGKVKVFLPGQFIFLRTRFHILYSFFCLCGRFTFFRYYFSHFTKPFHQFSLFNIDVKGLLLQREPPVV